MEFLKELAKKYSCSPEILEKIFNRVSSGSCRSQTLNRAITSQASSELEKGAKGDWQKEGYKLSHSFEQDPTDPKAKVIVVAAHSKDGKQVATIPLSFGWEETGKLLNPDDSWVLPEHRRKGLATAAYQYAERVTGGKINRAYEQTEDAHKLWSQPNRPFGKSHSPFLIALEKAKQILSKDIPQAKFDKLLPANQRPEQNVKRIAPSVQDSYEMQPLSPSEAVSTKQLTKPYGAQSATSVVSDMRNNPNNAVHDPYDTKMSFASTKAPHETVAHEGYHKTVTGLVDKIGVDSVHKLHDKMIGMIHPTLLQLIDSSLQTNPTYHRLRHSYSARQKLAYKEEVINFLRDMATGPGEKSRRAQIKEFYKKNDNYMHNLTGIEKFQYADKHIKDAWQKISTFANNVKKEDLD